MNAWQAEYELREPMSDKAMLEALAEAEYPDKTFQSLRNWLARNLLEYASAHQYLDELFVPQSVDSKILSLRERIKWLAKGNE